jgi:hypothetical protein
MSSPFTSLSDGLKKPARGTLGEGGGGASAVGEELRLRLGGIRNSADYGRLITTMLICNGGLITPWLRVLLRLEEEGHAAAASDRARGELLAL